jgi:signal transduction histidine kinase
MQAGILPLRGLIEQQDTGRLLQLLVDQSCILEMITEGAPLSLLLDHLVRALEKQADGMQCSVLLLSEDGKHLNLGAAPSLPDDYNRAADAHEIGPNEGSCGTAAYLREQVIVSDISTDVRWAKYKHIAAQFGLAACWSTPILSKHGKVLGTFAIYYGQPKSPSPLHLNLIGMATHLAAIAIEHAHSERERQRLVAELKTAVKTREEFLTIASHELRTPLTSLKLQTQLLFNMLRGSDELVGVSPEEHGRVTEQCALVALRQIDRLQALVADLLDVASLTAGRLPLKHEHVDLNALVHEVAQRFQDESVRKGSPLQIETAGELWGHWDWTRVDQILTNLLSNAFKFGLGKPVVIATERDERWARIRVRDSGIGIPEEQQMLLFQRFERAVSWEHYGGLGLGLWISRQLAEALGGTIRLYSRVGEGTTFTIELPARD